MSGTLVFAILVVLSAPVVAWTGYLFFLTLLSGVPAPPAAGSSRHRFCFVVPAHDEEEGIGATVASLSAVDYPAENRRIVVVADNCKDRTAERARAAGAEVMERQNAEKRGKGYALEHAFERIVAEGWADAVVVVDADSTVSKNMLGAFAARLDAGENAVQAEYGVRNPEASWRTRLIVIALALFHVLRSVARERMRVSTGLRGNGMCFSRKALETVPHDAFSVVEDVEYGIRLGRAGIRVAYAHEASVLGEMVSGGKAAETQRTRWEAGRIALAKQHGLPLLKEGIARRSLLLFDLAVDVLVPPLTYIALPAAAGAIAAGAAALAMPTTLARFAYLPWAAALAFLTFYVLRGVVLTGRGAKALLDLAMAPLYMAWKLAVAIRRRGARKDEWVRTARERTR